MVKSSRCPPIKGYLPVRLVLPPVVGVGGADGHFTTFIYLKEHSNKKGSETLFVANVPAGGPIRSDLLLGSLFEQYGDVQRVTVVQDPRKVEESSGDRAVELFREAALAGVDGGTASSRRKGDGKFAHVVFASSSELKKAMKLIKQEAANKSENRLHSICLGSDRIEELTRQTDRLQRQSDEVDEKSDDDEHDEAAGEDGSDMLTGVRAIAQEARVRAYRHMPRSELMEMCNSAMEAFEHEEVETERRAKMAAEQPDDDGFITVAQGAPSFGTTNDLEEDKHARRRAGKRNRKRKAGGSGADELQDFYRFQLKETRRKEVNDLKSMFEKDLAKVRKMKEERLYRPF
ncbi:hypothetical protein THAOC_11891 [Thalassiosira oceanica]|uniref:RRM domain-containing protein n=2 Tax=Thalassiosira oceanica TaxID=159749 RepID=K0T9A5_THAOC|nr:hypothetical protein THAOC_11891 [Thalassiosira oceanica]|eukprot:EJK67112.1 hypothetical protein THAOC_11891 [Thalassiosira oceanica]